MQYLKIFLDRCINSANVNLRGALCASAKHKETYRMTIRHKFKTDRIYNFPQEISLIIERDKITFDDPSRNIAGFIELESDHIITRAIDAGHIDLAKTLSKTWIMRAYDRGTHKWLSSFEAAQLFDV